MKIEHLSRTPEMISSVGLSRYSGTGLTDALTLDPVIRDAAWMTLQEFLKLENPPQDHPPGQTDDGWRTDFGTA